MRKVWAFLIIATLMIFQTLPQFKVFGFFPDLLVIFIVYYSFKVGVSQGIILGAVLGFCVDILSGAYVGTHSLAFSTVALSVEFFKVIFIFEVLFTVPIVSFFGTIIKYFVMFLLSLLFKSISLGEWYIAMFIEGIMNFAFAFPMIWLSNKIISLLHREYYMGI
ncbi:MAG: rod shape-determining protein MreD [Brevinematia bacterium]